MAQKILIFKIFFLIFFFNNNFAYTQSITGKAKVIDGDTIHIDKNKIRLHGIDAPERNQNCLYNNQEWACGKESTSALKKLINNQLINCKIKSIDRYNRYVAICFANEINLNKLMVKKGWATSYKYYSMDFILEEESARLNKEGIWRGTFEDPYEFRKNNK
jgi:endonuclease YncB( thermonuclease family)